MHSGVPIMGLPIRMKKQDRLAALPSKASIVNLSFFRKKPNASQTELSRREEEPDLSIADPVTIAGILEAFVKSRSKLSAHALDGHYLGSAMLLSCGDSQLTLRVTPAEEGQVVEDPLDLNFAGPSGKGAFRFTLHARQGEFPDLWQAEFPRKLVPVHSRRYRRIKSIRGPVHYASLIFPGAPAGMRIVDLSEEGVELEIPGATQPEWPITAGTLTLDQHNIHVPGIQLVHVSRASHGNWRVGVSLQGIDPASMRTFRRWLNVAETSGHHFRPLDQEDRPTRSKR